MSVYDIRGVETGLSHIDGVLPTLT